MKIIKYIGLSVFIITLILSCRSVDLSHKYLGEKLPGETPVIFGMDIISVPETIEFTPTFTQDYKEIYFTRRREGGINRIYFTRSLKGQWTEPVEVDFTEGLWANHPALSPDGKRLFFGSKLPLPNTDTPSNTSSTWYIDKGLFGWSSPRFLGSEVMKITVSDTGTIYYSDKSEGWNRATIVKRGLQEDGYTDPENINIPQTGQKVHPTISSNADFIIFDSEVLPGFGSSDLFISRRLESGAWSIPENLGKSINTSLSESCPVLSPDDSYLFFSREESESNSSIYWVNIKGLFL